LDVQGGFGLPAFGFRLSVSGFWISFPCRVIFVIPTITIVIPSGASNLGWLESEV
jgi:hypothetical protein